MAYLKKVNHISIAFRGQHKEGQRGSKKDQSRVSR